MRLGVAQVVPMDLRELSPGPIKLVADLGFSGLAWSTSDGVGADPKQWRSLRTLADGYGLSVCEVGVYGTNFITDEKEIVDNWLDRVREACEAVHVLGDDGDRPTAVVGCGSHNADGMWFWDKRNFSAESRRNLTVNLGRVGQIAESMDVDVALEGHVNVTASTPATAAAIVREAGSSALKVHLDPVNWMTLNECSDSTRFLDSMFEAIGALAGSCHAKDALVRNELITNVVEAPPGEGCLDYPEYMRLAGSLGANQWMVIEHLPLEGLAAAKAYVDQAIAIAEAYP